MPKTERLAIDSINNITEKVNTMLLYLNGNTYAGENAVHYKTICILLETRQLLLNQAVFTKEEFLLIKPL